MLKSKSTKKQVTSTATMRAQFGLPSISEIKKNFRKQMVIMSTEIVQIESEELRNDLLKCIEVNLRALNDYKNLNQLLDFVESNIDSLKMGIAIGLYGHLDLRTQKIIEKAEERAIDRAMMEDHRKD